MASAALDGGVFSSRLSLQRAEESGDGQGGIAVSWMPVADLWARIEPVAARQTFEAGEVSETVTHRITCRFRDGIEAGRRFVKGSRRFAILTVHDPDETGRYLVCGCEEVTS